MRELLWNTYNALVGVLRSNGSLRPGCREANRQRSPSRHQSMATSGSQHSAAEPLSKCHNKTCIRSSPVGNSRLDVAEQEETEARKSLPLLCVFGSNLPRQAPEHAAPESRGLTGNVKSSDITRGLRSRDNDLRFVFAPSEENTSITPKRTGEDNSGIGHYARPMLLNNWRLPSPDVSHVGVPYSG
jgi:hypothetical protein